MLYIFLSICCSVVVSVMLKLAKRYHVDVYQAVTWNYCMAFFLAFIFLKPHLQNIGQVPVLSYLLLAVLLPSLFVVLATSVRISGIVRTDIAQRLSLLISLVAAFWLFNEPLNWQKGLGITLGLTAILFSVQWQRNGEHKKTNMNSWLFLLLVFVGFGVIDILFKQMAAATFGTALFVVFFLAFMISLAGLFYQVLAGTMKFSWPHILIGWSLGIVNFGNILFYLKALGALSKHPSTVFSGMNIGVIVLGSLTGLIIFKEKLSLLNKIGIALAIIAVIIIARS